MESYMKLDGDGFDLRVRVNWRAIADFIKSADSLYRAAKATAVGVAVWLLLRWWFGF
jgi:hypothetical protein